MLLTYIHFWKSEYLKYILEEKSYIVSAVALVLVPCYTWKTLYSSYKQLKCQYEEAFLFHRRHNCVIMYAQIKGMSGWPPFTEKFIFDFNKQDCLEIIQEPILHFINNAKISLDIAFMLVNVNSVFTALKKAHKKGIKVRLLLNFQHCDKVEKFQILVKEGIEVLTYISQKPRMSSIMHYKYMIKDFTESRGFVFTGSLNLSGSGFCNNYEDIVFSSNYKIVKSFHENFEKCWNFVKLDNENIINKTTLLDANLV